MATEMANDGISQLHSFVHFAPNHSDLRLVVHRLINIPPSSCFGLSDTSTVNGQELIALLSTTRPPHRTLPNSTPLTVAIASLLDKIRQIRIIPSDLVVLRLFAQPVHRPWNDVTAHNDNSADDEDEDDVEDVVGCVVAALGDLRVAHPGVVASRWGDEGVVLGVFVAGYELPGTVSWGLCRIFGCPWNGGLPYGELCGDEDGGEPTLHLEDPLILSDRVGTPRKRPRSGSQ